MSINSPVRTLNPEVARKIAAGEVIDRPNAIVRELMDNAIDSGADSITVEISGGGIDKIRILDNGSGMTKEDLENCARPHSTSKISTETDLLNLSTLGFRGEALASIAAVTRLSITSGGWKMRASITEDHILEKTAEYEGTIVQAEGLFENFPARRIFLKRNATEATLCKNTFIEKCLPEPEKAFRFINDGEIKIDLPKNQTLKERFLLANDIKENSKLFYQVEGKDSKNSEWSFKIIIGEPGIRRPNKKDISIFVNGRKIQEYALVQAIEYGGQGFFPNGTFPVAAAFIQINPSLVDFNIHPAKKEVKFKDIASLHHGISSTLKAFFENYTNTEIKNSFENENSEKKEEFSSNTKSSDSFMEKRDLFNSASEKFNTFKNPSSLWERTAFPKMTYNNEGEKSYSSMRDRFFNASSSVHQNLSQNEENSLTITKRENKDNAAIISEKMSVIIENFNNSYEKLTSVESSNTISDSSPSFTSLKQNSEIKKESEEVSDSSTFSRKDDFHFIGSALGTFLIAEKNNSLYIIDKHASHERMIFDKIMENQEKCQSLLIPYEIETKDENEDKYLESIQEELKKIGFTCQNQGEGKWIFTTLNERWKGSQEDLEHALFDKKVAPKDLIYSMAAMTACKAAVKDGWTLLDSTAEEIAKGALALKDPHCPHGRPCYYKITREELFRFVRRSE